MKLKSGLRAWWRSSTVAQIGEDPRFRIQLNITNDAEHDVLSFLEEETSLPAMRGVLDRNGGDRARATELVEYIAKAGLLEPSRERSAQWRIGEPHRTRFTPDAASRALLEHGDGWASILRRTQSVIGVSGLGRAGARAAQLIAAAGFKRIVLADRTKVGPYDVGETFRHQEIGLPRDQALTAMLRRQGYVACVGQRGSRIRPDAVLHFSDEITVPSGPLRLRNAGIPHLVITMKEASAQLGPWVIPGRTPCSECAYRSLIDDDDRWPAIATQQAARPVLAKRGQDMVLASMTGTLAATYLIAELEGFRTACSGGVLTVEFPGMTIERTDLSFHADCACRQAQGLDAVESKKAA